MNVFSFMSGSGITRTINLGQKPWPFRNDFGSAFTFRSESFSLEKDCVLLRVIDERGCGFEISTIPLPLVAVLSIKIVENHSMVECIKVNNCPLHARVWYHIAVRFTRSRLKGVFSLSSREQLTVFIDGNIMLTEALKFPQIRHDSPKTLSFAVGEKFDGQMDSIYIFHDNISDATIKAIFEMKSEKNSGIEKSRSKKRESKPTYHQEIPSRNIQWDDLEHIIVDRCATSKECDVKRDVADLSEDIEITNGGNNPLSKSSFMSRLYISWNPRRRENDFLMELHSGAHVLLNNHCVQATCIEGAQQVLGSIGGIQNVITIFCTLLGERSIENVATNRIDTVVINALVIDLIDLLSNFIYSNERNGREILRIGGIDIVEHLLFQLKSKSASYNGYSMICCLFTCPNLSKVLVHALLRLKSSCSHCISLEKKIMSGLVFNIPLWFEGLSHDAGVSLYQYLLPVLNDDVQKYPHKVRDYIGVEHMMFFIKELIETKVRVIITQSDRMI